MVVECCHVHLLYMYTSQPSEGLEAPFVVWWTPTPCPFFSPETKMAARMPCHHHPSSTSSSYTAMISPRSGTRKVAFSFSTSAHGSSSLSHLSLTPATDNKKVGTYTWSRTWYNKEGMQLGALVVLICFLYKLIGVWRPIERDSLLQRWEGGDDLRRVWRRPKARNKVAGESLFPMVSIWISEYSGSWFSVCWQVISVTNILYLCSTVL